MDDYNSSEEKVTRKKSVRLKKRLLKKQHTHGGKSYPVGTPLENLKASDSDIAFLEKRDKV